MADYGNSFRRTSGGGREDPRLSRRDSASAKDSSSANKRPTNWEGQTYPMQTSYQHLQGHLYNDPNQYATQSYQNAYAGYPNYAAPSGYVATAAYGTGYAAGMQPVPPGDEYPQGGWAPVGAAYVASQHQQGASTSTEKNQHSDGIAQEIEHQKAELIKQRDEYNKRVSVLRKELDLLRRQKQELMQDHTSDRNTDKIVRENGKLQIEIQNKLKDAYKVIDIFTGLIGDEGRGRTKRSEEASERDGKKSSSSEAYDSKSNYVHYDPELHWCRMCDVFPKTAKDLLVHLQGKEHRANVQEDEIPWHKLPPEPEFPFTEGAPTKRLPIKGLQFFVSTPAWYCRLCDTWIGDLHCASHHLKSIKHSQNYSNFVEQNPHWEIEWLKDREKALGRVSRHNRSSDSDDARESSAVAAAKSKKKHKKRSSSPGASFRDKRKKKRSKRRRRDSTDSSSSSASSSSSSEDDDEDDEDEDNNRDTTKSIHVAMRNKMKLQAQMLMNEHEITGKWEAIGRLVEERKKKEAMEGKEREDDEDKMINQWMTVSRPQQDKDRALLSNLKDRLRQKQEAERVRCAEAERQRQEREREERERRERAEREARELEELRRRERDEIERLKEIREQIRFKPKSGGGGGGAERDHRYRRSRKSRSRSPSSENRRRSPDKHRRYENGNRSHDYEETAARGKRVPPDDAKKPPPPPPPYKKLPFIGRMPLFKNKKPDDKPENREIKKEDYDVPRQTRFQPGTLARAFIPEPEVVCFPKLSSYPELAPPPPAPPKISEPIPSAPPPPKINAEKEKPKEEVTMKPKEGKINNSNNNLNAGGDDHHVEDMMIMDYMDMDYTMMYQPPMFDYQSGAHGGGGGGGAQGVPLSHTLPLQPPPLPPDDPNDDLALLGISSDDLAVQIVK